MAEIAKEIIQEKKEKIKEHVKENKKLWKEIKELKDKKCSFCQKLLPIDKNNYLKNRYKLKFWNNQKEDNRLICYGCLKYGWTRGLPLIDGTLTNPNNPVGSWSKRRTFKIYMKKGYFKENENNEK